MSSAPRAALYWIRAWWPVALSIVLILIESTPAFGANRTAGPMRRLVQLIFGPVSDAHWSMIHAVIRKGGHFVVYGSIGLAWLRAWRISLPRLRFLPNSILLAVLSTCALASWDEWHQSFFPNRGPSPWDVLLDCTGATIMCLLAYLLLSLLRTRRRMADRAYE